MSNQKQRLLKTMRHQPHIESHEPVTFHHYIDRSKERKSDINIVYEQDEDRPAERTVRISFPPYSSNEKKYDELRDTMQVTEAFAPREVTSRYVPTLSYDHVTPESFAKIILSIAGDEQQNWLKPNDVRDILKGIPDMKRVDVAPDQPYDYGYGLIKCCDVDCIERSGVPEGQRRYYDVIPDPLIQEIDKIKLLREDGVFTGGGHRPGVALVTNIELALPPTHPTVAKLIKHFKSAKINVSKRDYTSAKYDRKADKKTAEELVSDTTMLTVAADAARTASELAQAGMLMPAPLVRQLGVLCEERPSQDKFIEIPATLDLTDSPSERSAGEVRVNIR